MNMNPIELAGRYTSLNTIPVTPGGADGTSGSLKQIAGKPSLTVTYGSANEVANIVERNSADGRERDKILSGEPPVPKTNFLDPFGVPVTDLV